MGPTGAGKSSVGSQDSFTSRKPGKTDSGMLAHKDSDTVLV